MMMPYRRSQPTFCDSVHEPTDARCYKDPDDYHGVMHTGWSHYPAQLVAWAVDTLHPVGNSGESQVPTEPSLTLDRCDHCKHQWHGLSCAALVPINPKQWGDGTRACGCVSAISEYRVEPREREHMTTVTNPNECPTCGVLYMWHVEHRMTCPNGHHWSAPWAAGNS